MVSPTRDFAKEEEQEEIEKFADILEKSTITIGIDAIVLPRSKKWIIDGLRLLAKQD
jgi:hypothetical protein